MLTFAQAARKFADRPRGHKSLRLEWNIRLVCLDEDTFGVQFRNTYLVRIRRSGHWTLNTCYRRTAEALKVINAYSPAQLSWTAPVKPPRWIYRNGVEFQDYDTVGTDGLPVEKI